MENASKALLIAGSILIVILLIVIGMNVLKSTSGTTEAVQITMNTAELTTFNNKFIQYIGSNKSSSEVKALANLVIASNATNKNYQVTFNTKSVANDIITLVAGFTGENYTIGITYDEKGERIIAVSATPS